MATKIHLEGLGIIGSLLALKLEQQGVKFTWNDIDAPVCAWKASTGCIYPSGDEFDMKNYDAWRFGYFGKLPEFEEARYCFLSKHPPHKGKYAFHQEGVWGVAVPPSLHLNAQRLVPRVRRLFAERQLTSCPKGAQLIVSHGFGQRLHHVLWGWMAKVKLHNAIDRFSGNSCYYMRVGRFKLAYAYPIPMELGWFYAGSSLITQRQAKPLLIEPKFKKWKQHVRDYTYLNVESVGASVQGWRPAAAPDDDRLLRVISGRWTLKPLWSSGIRHAPSVVQAVLDKL